MFESEPDAPTALVATLKTDGGALRTVQVGWGQSDGAEEYRIVLSSTVGSGTLETTLAEGITGISRSVQVPAHKMRVSRIFVEACNTGGTDCVRSEAGATLAAESVNSLIGYFKSSAAGSGEKFGTDVALSADGKTLAVGVPEENGEGSSGTTLVDSGAVVVFRESEGIWVEQAKVLPDVAVRGAYDRFGKSLALSADGNTLVVGAPDEDSASTGVSASASSDESASGAGAVYVFTYSESAWSLSAFLKASNAGGADAFGAALSVSNDGSLIAVGAPGEDSSLAGGPSSNDAAGSGAVYVFAMGGSGWAQEALLKASAAAEGDLFGTSLDLSGDGGSLAVGAHEAEGDAGNVHVFRRDEGEWSTEALLRASNAGTSDQFGISVGISDDGNTLAVGALYEDSNATGVGGDGSNDSATNSGAAYVFKRSGTTWSEEAYVKASNSGAADLFGGAVALSGDGKTLAVTAAQEDGGLIGVNSDAVAADVANSGAVYVFARSTDGWNQVSTVKTLSLDMSDLGTVMTSPALALSEDGNTLAVAAPLEDSASQGVGSGNPDDDSAPSSGAVYLF